jgi:hypothetical protein
LSGGSTQQCGSSPSPANSNAKTRQSTAFFPTTSAPQSFAIVTDPDRNVIDHWLVRFNSYLPTETSKGSVQVIGAITEVRIGGKDSGGTAKVGACWLTWRPCVPQALVDLLDKPATTASPANSSSAPADPTLVYRLADEGSLQTYVAPYYFIQQDDDGVFVPASAYSPAVAIVGDGSSGRLRLRTLVVRDSKNAESSGNYVYRWACRDMTSIWGEIKDVGSDSVVELDPGVYDVILRVTDLDTGVVIFTEQSIFTDMFVPANGLNSTAITIP